VAADVVVGQNTMLTSGSGSASATNMYYPEVVSGDGTRLYVADSTYHRVLIWNPIPTASGTPATSVLGQPNMTSGTSNYGGISSQSLSYPVGLYSDGTRIFVGDTGNFRIVLFPVP
jgi:hypothetical protein